MDAIPARVLALGRSYATNDPVIHSVKYIAFPAANPLSSPPAPSGIDYPASVGWHLTPDEAYALHLSEFGFLNIFRLKEGSGNTFPDLDVSSLANDLLLVYGVPCAGAPASYRALLRSGITINSQEPCYAWVAPPGYSSLGDQTVVNRLAREGRLRPLVASDVPTLLSQWYVLVLQIMREVGKLFVSQEVHDE